jgi:hypothetical protein
MSNEYREAKADQKKSNGQKETGVYDIAREWEKLGNRSSYLYRI